MKAVQSLVVSETACPSTQCHIPDDFNLQQHHCDYPRSCRHYGYRAVYQSPPKVSFLLDPKIIHPAGMRNKTLLDEPYIATLLAHFPTKSFSNLPQYFLRMYPDHTLMLICVISPRHIQLQLRLYSFDRNFVPLPRVHCCLHRSGGGGVWGMSQLDVLLF